MAGHCSEAGVRSLLLFVQVLSVELAATSGCSDWPSEARTSRAAAALGTRVSSAFALDSPPTLMPEQRLRQGNVAMACGRVRCLAAYFGLFVSGDDFFADGEDI